MATSKVGAIEWVAVIAGSPTVWLCQNPLLRPETPGMAHTLRYLRAEVALAITIGMSSSDVLWPRIHQRNAQNMG